MDSATALLGTALTIGVTHTLIGVDHTLPFILLGRARQWSLRRTLAITALCGVGHVLSSVVLGAVGIALGTAVGKLEWIESTRGELAAWLMIGLGIAYATWGVFRSRRGHGHSHLHVHDDGTVHQHRHDHHAHDEGAAHALDAHHHPHAARAPRTVAREAGPVVLALFVVFVVGPCEALIPLLMVPSFQAHVGLSVAVTALFGLSTIATMLVVVSMGYVGLRIPRLRALEPHLHTVAGATIAAGGLGIQLLGI